MILRANEIAREYRSPARAVCKFICVSLRNCRTLVQGNKRGHELGQPFRLRCIIVEYAYPNKFSSQSLSDKKYIIVYPDQREAEIISTTMATAAEAPVNNESAQRRGMAPMKKPSGKGKPRTKQPKKVKFITTEIRCQEKSKGGLCYEVILAEPTVPKRAPSPPQPSPTQQSAIEDKLRAAEERRLSLEAHKLAALAAKLSKIEEVSRKKDLLSAAFMTATRESLDAKMNNTEEKREAHIAELKGKLKEHLESVEKTRLSLEQQTEEVRTAVEEKLKTAAAQRDENIKKMLDRLKEHEEQVARVRSGMTERVQQLETQIQGKLDQARERRETIEREQKEKLRNHNTVKIAKAAKMREMADVCAMKELEAKKREFDMRVTTAELNRQREIQRRVQAIRQHERRAEIVRQNKAALASQEMKSEEQNALPVENETASSG